MPPSPATAAPGPAAGAPSPTVAAPSAATRTYEVKAGDTLAGIALANLPDGVTLDQMLVALYRQNEDAFLERNMNRVREGSTLTLPTAQSAAAVNNEEASQVVRTQTEEYEAFRRSVAPPAAAAAAAGGARDQLRLAKDESTARADDLAAYDREIKEVNERIARLEKHLNDMQQLLELKNEQLARLEAQAKSGLASQKAGKAPARPSSQLKGTPAEVEFKKTHPCPATGEKGETCSGYVITHVVPLCAGGANVPANMQWLRLEEAIEKERAAQERCPRS
jgi:pilus assembly protein FimV